ncbi:hypothetical protein QE152_g34270 [Popillia japonica]|uniref:Uncharacterized protein n=1 Tax=Popillia japonica TaxID=7064 RepID=A0AAW1IUG0_POPJA
MLYKTLFLIIGSLLLTEVWTQNTTVTPLENTTQDENTTPKYYDLPVYSLHYNLSEAKISELAFELLIQEQFLSLLSTQDILTLLQKHRLIVSTKLLEINFQKLMAHGMEITTILHELIPHVPGKKYQNMMIIADNFNIDFLKYQEYFMEQDEKNLLILFSSGNYTKETIAATLDVMNMTESEVVEIITRISLEHMVSLPTRSIATQYQEQLEDLLTKQTLEIGDIKMYESFDSMLNTFQDLVNSEAFWTTAVAPTSLVSALNASLFTQQYGSYVTPYLINIQSQVVEIVDSITSNNTLTELTVAKDLASHFSMKYNPKRVKECYCFGIDNVTGLSVCVPNNITLTQNLIIIENDGCSHNYGSPLICQKQLYGILTMWDEDRLAYQTFSHKENEEVPNVMPPLVEVNPNSGNARDLWVPVYLLFIIHVIVINS